MKHMLRFTPIAAALVLVAAGSVQAQTSNRSVAQTPQRPAPSTFAAPTPGPGAPVAAGLPSPQQSPGGLTSRFPAGLPSPSPFPAGMAPVASPVVPSLPATNAGSGGTSSGTVVTTTATGTIVTPAIDGTVLSSPTVIGGAGVAGGAYGGGAAAGAAAAGAPGQTMGAPAAPSGSFGAGPYTALQLSQSFLQADVNRDGELTRAEAQRLTIMPLGFDDMDRDKNGVISRSEYDDSTR